MDSHNQNFRNQILSQALIMRPLNIPYHWTLRTSLCFPKQAGKGENVFRYTYIERCFFTAKAVRGKDACDDKQ